jgi:scyllo-inositol 2-dehydrogenase (NADP+)
MADNRIIKTGLIGFGTGGEFFHAPFIHALDKGFELTAILERTKDKSKLRYPNSKIVRTFEELLSIKELELIVITTPNDTHFDLAKKALEAGKHVILDKPFTVTSEESEALILLAKKKERILTVYHNRRFHSDFRTVQMLLAKNELGEVKEFLACFDRFRPELRPNMWKEVERPGSGILYDLGSHLIDQVLVLFGKPLAISAELKIERPGAKAIDYFDLTFHYKDHKAILKSGMLVREPGPIFKLTGTKATYTKYGTDPQEAMLRAGSVPKGEEWAKESEEAWGEIKSNGTTRKVFPVYSDYREFYWNVYRAITVGEPLAVTPEQAALVIRCIEIAIRSSVENKAKISL